MRTPIAIVASGLATLLLAGACAPAAPPPAAPGGGAVSAVPPAVKAPAPSNGLTHMQIDVAVKDAPYAFYEIGIEKGYYAAEGIDLELTSSAGTTSIASVLSGDLPFTTASSASLSAILKGGTMKIILTNMDRPAYELWSSGPDVHSLQDLEGKTVGVITRGDTMEISTRLILQSAGVNPDGVSYTALGAGETRLAAVESGAVSAAVLGIGDANKLRQDGPKGTLVADYASDVHMLFNGLATSDKLIQENPDLVTRFMRATIKAREYFRQYKEQTLAIVSKYNGASREVNEPDYDSIIATMTPDGSLPESVQAADAGVRAKLIGAPTVRPLSEMFDYHFAQAAYAELARTGWQPEP